MCIYGCEERSGRERGYIVSYTCIPILYINMFLTMLAPGINTKNAVPSFDLCLTCREITVRCLRKERLGNSTIYIHIYVRQYTGRENLEQFPTTESWAWASVINSYSLTAQMFLNLPYVLWEYPHGNTLRLAWSHFPAPYSPHTFSMGHDIR